jgi:hypothetical protein
MPVTDSDKPARPALCRKRIIVNIEPREFRSTTSHSRTRSHCTPKGRRPDEASLIQASVSRCSALGPGALANATIVSSLPHG